MLRQADQSARKVSFRTRQGETQVLLPKSTN
jgi:hypothetical protein